jgi:integrating conjugative element protein (TIGR03757 family)
MFHHWTQTARGGLQIDALRLQPPPACSSGVRPLRMTARTGSPAANDALRRVWTLLLVTACGLACEVPASETEVWVVTDREHPIQVTPGARLIELDAPARIKAELSSKLPSGPAQASLIVQLRLKHGGAELQERLANAYQGVIDAWSLGVIKIPAIVIDRRYVVYGETDTLRALARVEDYLRRSQK